MRKLISLSLAVVLLLSCTVTAFAVEDDPVEIGVYAKTECSIEGEYTAPIENGSASVTTPDGTVSVTNTPTDAVTLVVIPMEDEALTWIAGCVEDNAVAAYDIHFRDAQGNRINANGAKVSIAVSGTKLSVSSVTTSGADQTLTSEVAGGEVSFTTDGSHYYVIAGKTVEDTTHNINIIEPEGGEVTVSTTTPKTGETVTITAKPNNGKVVDKVTVTDENGKAVKIKDNGDGTYSFEQPDGDVTVKVTFKNKPSSGDTPQTGDNSNIWLWLILLIISATMLIYMGSKMRKRSAE